MLYAALDHLSPPWILAVSFLLGLIPWALMIGACWFRGHGEKRRATIHKRLHEWPPR